MVPLHMEQYHSSLVQTPASKSLVDEQVLSISSSISSDLILESETILSRTIRSFGFLLCSCLLITNSLRLGIFLIPRFGPSIIEASSNMCFLQGFLLHVFALFHFNLTITIRLFWHYCFIFSHYWQTVTYSRLCAYLSSLLILMCLLTWPSLSHEWGSMFFDPFFKICLVDYTFRLSYTFFILILTCFIPFTFLIVSHYEQMKSIDRRIEKHLSTLSLEQERPPSQIHFWRKQFQCASWVILIWSFVNILLLIGIHIRSEHRSIKSTLYYMQLTAFLFDPLLYIFIFRSLNIVTLLRPTEKLDR